MFVSCTAICKGAWRADSARFTDSVCLCVAQPPPKVTSVADSRKIRAVAKLAKVCPERAEELLEEVKSALGFHLACRAWSDFAYVFRLWLPQAGGDVEAAVRLEKGPDDDSSFDGEREEEGGGGGGEEEGSRSSKVRFAGEEGREGAAGGRELRERMRQQQLVKEMLMKKGGAGFALPGQAEDKHRAAGVEAEDFGEPQPPARANRGVLKVSGKGHEEEEDEEREESLGPVPKPPSRPRHQVGGGGSSGGRGGRGDARPIKRYEGKFKEGEGGSRGKADGPEAEQMANKPAGGGGLFDGLLEMVVSPLLGGGCGAQMVSGAARGCRQPRLGVEWLGRKAL